MENNFYDTWVPDGDGDTFESELANNKRLLELNTTRLEYLRARDPRLELVRAGQTHLYEEYEQLFLGKIQEFKANVAAIERRIREQCAVLHDAKIFICPSSYYLDSWYIQLGFESLTYAEPPLECRSAWHISLGHAGRAWMHPGHAYDTCPELGWYSGTSYGDIRVKIIGHERKPESNYGKLLVGEILEPAGLTFENIFRDACTSSRDFMDKELHISYKLS